MKVVILTMTCGDGHNVISNALKRELQSRNVEAEVVNIYRSDKLRYNFNSIAYVVAVKHFPKLYSHFWHKCKNRNPELRFRNDSVHRSLKKIQKDILDEIINYGADAVIATNAYCCVLTNELRRKNLLPKHIKLYAMNTDIFACTDWESAILNDKLFIIDEKATDEFIYRGFKPEQIVVAGFATNKAFLQHYDKAQARKDYGLDENKFTVMLCSGGFGLTKNYKIIKYLAKANLPVQIVCMNGKNKKYFKRTQKVIDKFKLNNVLNFGYVDNMVSIMAACDIVRSRGGCSTLHEAISQRLPILISNDVINQEQDNAVFFEEKGISIKLKNDKQDLVEKIKLLMQNKELYAKMQQNCENYKHTNGIDVICDYVIEDITNCQNAK